MTGLGGLPGWLGTVAIIAGAVAVFFAAFTSKYQKKLNADREGYIASLEAQRVEAEHERKELRDKYNHLKGTVDFMERLLTGKCPDCEIDPVAGGCRFCTRHRLYGQQPPTPTTQEGPK